ncbi:MAG TPA: diguanylate cyclase, partial [Sulfuricurvum sp.]|nr:diguanylate cyclase [Sulfuricurvum sp.]
MVGIYRSDTFGNILYVNSALAKILSFDSSDDLIGEKSVLRYKTPEERAIFIEKLFKARYLNNYEVELLDKYGVPIPVMVSAMLEENILSGMIIDMREIKESRKEIEKLSKAVEQVDDIVYITDKAGNISYVNEAYIHHTGYTREDAIGNNSRISKSGMHDQPFYKELWTMILSGEVYRNTLINRKKNGDLYYEKKTITPLKDDNHQIIGFISTGKDVTEETMLNQEIERIAMIDKLTGIYNRHKFEEFFVLESERSRRFSLPLSMILIDIDHFKSVNDTYGHDVGDEVLKGLALVVQTNIRKNDIFARWGGEEFLVLSPGANEKSIQELAEKLRKSVEAAVFPEVGRITISLGISTFEQDNSFSEFFKRVDEGLYIAKANGRNQVGSI